MAISLPLPSTALAAHPLCLALSLDALTAPAPPPTPGASQDVFDALDLAAGSWAPENVLELAGDAAGGDDDRTRLDERMDSDELALGDNDAQGSADFRDALSDSHGVLYAQGEVRQIGAEEQHDAPSWMRETSGRITAMAVGVAKLPSHDTKESGARAEGMGRGDAVRRHPRVAVGCEDGALWVFAPPPSAAGVPARRTHDAAGAPAVGGDTDVSTRRVSDDSFLDPSPGSPPLPRSPLHSPPLSPPSRSRTPLPSSTSPRLASRRSSSSLSLASLATARTKRISSTSASMAHSHSTSGSASAITSYELVRSHSRPRKASATVSVSTSSVAPTSHAHPHATSGDHRTSAEDHPQTPLSPSPSSPPLSPTAVSPLLPHFVFSSPSRPPSVLHGSLQSRKEAAASPHPASVSSATALNRRTHSRAKGSIATGIGLWEESSSGATSPRDEVEDPLTAREEAPALEPPFATELKPVLRVVTSGKGAVVALEVLEGLKSAGAVEGEGAAVAVLRESGHLSIVSLVDGRVFGSCDVGAKVPSTSRTASPRFDGLRVAKVAGFTVGICIGASGTPAFVPVNLDTLVAQDAVEHHGSPDCIVLLPAEDAATLIYLPPSPPTGEPIEFFARRVEASPLTLEETSPIGVLPSAGSALRGLQACGDRLISWDEAGLTLFEFANGRLAPLQNLDLPGVTAVRDDDAGRRFVAVARSGVSMYDVQACEANTVAITLVDQAAAVGVEAVALHAGSAIVARVSVEGARSLGLLPRRPNDDPGSLVDGGAHTLAQLYRSSPHAARVQVTALNALGTERVVLGYNNGGIAVLDLVDLAHTSALPQFCAELSGAITLLDVVEFGGRQVVVAGSSTGAAGVWSLSDWDLVGRWQLFASPVKHYAYLDASSSAAPPRLSNSIAFISANSPVAVVSLFPPALLFTLPGTKSAVELLATTKDEILVVYEQGLARTCDIKSRELRRSMERKTAEGVLQEGFWTTWFRLDKIAPSSPVHPLVSLDLRTFLDEATRQLPWTGSATAPVEQDDTPRASPDFTRKRDTCLARDNRGAARSLIAMLATFAVDPGVDELLAQLGVEPPEAKLAVGLSSLDGVAFAASRAAKTPWSISPVVTAQRLIQLVCLLRVFLNYPDTERTASEAIVYFASCLADTVGAAFSPPSLDVLAQFWLDRNVEVQQAARSLFGTYLAAMPDDHVGALVEAWHEQLPAIQHGNRVLHRHEDQALLIIGLIAVDRFELLSSSVLVDISISVAAYLEENAHPYHQAVAAELCSRGFAIWQNYVDAMALVRALFGLAIGRNPSTPNDLRILARNATLHVAGINTPLFMTTLLHDILNASTASSRNATLKLLGFMIRKKPLVLYSNLPRVVEAVVKSLDPTISALRETVQQSATFILNELVRTFPSIDFHGKSQRLAVGTAEGAAIVFDLRTATRLYVLEGHNRPVTALSWSPDGHRLVTVSLEENRVVVWRVSGGLFGMFMAGTPARQGSGAQATPFKTYDFHVGDEALMTTAATLEWVVMDWPADRTVRLRIRETALKFGV